jgi:sporulation protein YlmC with PRC-barrel domain
MRNYLTDTAIIAAFAFAATPALAEQQQMQDDKSQQQQGNVDVVTKSEVSLDEWGYEGLYKDTWTAQQMIDAPVFGPTGEEIGDVENVMVGSKSTVDSLILEIGGLIDIGDTHIRVPWSEVNAQFQGEGEPRIEVPVTQETIEELAEGDYDVFGGAAGEVTTGGDDQASKPRAWRATELIDDYVVLENGEAYGWVEDLVFSNAGRLEAVVVDALYGAAYGPYAYPFYGYEYGFAPGNPYYELPYEEEEIASLEPLEREWVESVEVTDE